MPIPASQVRLPPGPARDEAMRQEYRKWKKMEEKKREEEKERKEKERRSSQPTATARATATATATAIEPNSREAFGKLYPIPETRPDAFRVLKLNPNATLLDIRRSYISNSLLVHPDKGSSNDERTRLECTAKQQQVQAAYELLIKPKGGKKRRTMQKSNSKRLNKHFNKSRRHTQT